MKIMVISDLHYDKRIFHGIDESKAWEWLLSIVDYHRPDLLLSCGDWGHDINREEFYELLKRTLVFSIYGDHENVNVLKSLYNIRTDNQLPVLMEDGRVYRINNLNIAGTNGIIASERKVKKGVPRKLAEDFIEIANKLRNEDIDILLIHEVPALKEVYPEIRVDHATRAVLEAIRIVKPKLVFNGHLHWSCYSTYRFEDIGTLYIRVDSSQKHRCYAILYPNSMKVEIWRDFKLLTKVL